MNDQTIAAETPAEQPASEPAPEKKPFSIRLGLIPRDELDGDEYHRLPGISKSGLGAIAQSPLHYITYKNNPKPATPALAFGKAYHHFILEPDTFYDHFVPAPSGAPKRPTIAQINSKKPSPEAIDSIAFWTAFDKEHAGKSIIDSAGDPSKGIWGRSDWDTLRYMRDALLDPVKNANICLLLAPHLIGESDEPMDTRIEKSSGGPTEMSAFIIDKDPPYSGGFLYPATNKLVKVRTDKLNTDHNILVDLKTAIDASLSGFDRSCAEFDYHVQHAMYTDVFRQVGRPVNGFVFVAQEKQPPYAAAPYELQKRAVDLGMDLYRRRLELYAKCHSENSWPGYDQNIRPIELPGWAYRVEIS